MDIVYDSLSARTFQGGWRHGMDWLPRIGFCLKIFSNIIMLIRLKVIFACFRCKEICNMHSRKSTLKYIKYLVYAAMLFAVPSTSLRPIFWPNLAPFWANFLSLWKMENILHSVCHFKQSEFGPIWPFHAGKPSTFKKKSLWISILCSSTFQFVFDGGKNQYQILPTLMGILSNPWTGT